MDRMSSAGDELEDQVMFIYQRFKSLVAVMLLVRLFLCYSLDFVF